MCFDQQRNIKKKKTQREEEEEEEKKDEEKEEEEEASFKAPQGSIIPAIEMTPWVPRRRP